MAIKPLCSCWLAVDPVQIFPPSMENVTEDTLQPGMLYSMDNFSAGIKADSKLQFLFMLFPCNSSLTADEGSSYCFGGETLMLGR